MAEDDPGWKQAHQTALQKTRQQQDLKKAKEREQKQQAFEQLVSDHWGGEDPAKAVEQGGGMGASDALIKDLKNFDGGGLLYIATGDTVMQAIQFMAGQRVGLVLVCDAEGHLAGVLSERDIIRVIAGHGPDTLEMAVENFITTDVATCTTKDRIGDVATMMSERRIRHVPVVDDGVLKGMISATDMVHHLAKAGSR